MIKDRCRCGNLVPKDAEFQEHGGVCRACSRERREAIDKAAKQAEFERLKALCLSQHPFYAHVP